MKLHMKRKDSWIMALEHHCAKCIMLQVKFCFLSCQSTFKFGLNLEMSRKYSVHSVSSAIPLYHHLQPKRYILQSGSEVQLWQYPNISLNVTGQWFEPYIFFCFLFYFYPFFYFSSILLFLKLIFPRKKFRKNVNTLHYL